VGWDDLPWHRHLGHLEGDVAAMAQNPGANLGQVLAGARHRSKWYIDDSHGPLLFGLGIHGQYLFVDAERQLLVAKVSSRELPLDAPRVTATLRAVSAVRRALAG
jgi:CubicO group peptidase (beta-lactamase class C family)